MRGTKRGWGSARGWWTCNPPSSVARLRRSAPAGLSIGTPPFFPADDVKQLVAAAKADPGKLSFASPGFGATQHFTGELFRQTAGIDILHVPFRTSPEAISAVLGKQVDVLFDTVSAVLGPGHAGPPQTPPGAPQGPP